MVLEEGCPQAQGFLFGAPAEAVVGGPQLRIVGEPALARRAAASRTQRPFKRPRGGFGL
jgi:EAL domain-containing protein (putative c-di-GMP-specific phosphodiesterase class I)